MSELYNIYDLGERRTLQDTLVQIDYAIADQQSTTELIFPSITDRSLIQSKIRAHVLSLPGMSPERAYAATEHYIMSREQEATSTPAVQLGNLALNLPKRFTSPQPSGAAKIIDLASYRTMRS